MERRVVAAASRRWWLWGSWLLPVAAAALALGIALSGTRPAALSRAETADGRRLGLTLAERRALYRDIVSHDAQWQHFARQRFADDAWAQADHWTDNMSEHVRTIARERGLSVVQILLTYDEGLHAAWRGAGGRALPGSWPPLTLRKRR